MHYVYILCCSDGSLYTGYAKDVDDRLSRHNAGKGAKYTRSRLPVQLAAYWSFPTKSAALKEEYRIKQLTRSKKLKLINEWREGWLPPLGEGSREIASL